MNEAERLAYLDAMGVESYMPRVVLPGALPSELCDMPELTEVATSLPVAAPQRVAEPPRSVATSVTTSTTTPTQMTVRFHWVIFQPTPAMLLLIPSAHKDQNCMQLLKKILGAIGVVAPLTELENFVWPPVLSSPSNLAVSNNSLADAKETLHALLEGYQLKQKKIQGSIDHVLVFDENLGQTLFDDFNIPGIQARILPSLQLMLNSSPEKVAALKQAAWQRLKDLKKA